MKKLFYKKMNNNQILRCAVILIIFFTTLGFGKVHDFTNIKIKEQKCIDTFIQGSLQEIEEALFQIIVLKCDYVEYKFENSIEKINLLIKTNQNVKIRQKSRITKIILQNFEMFDLPDKMGNLNADTIYENILIQFEDALLKYLEITGKLKF